MKSDETQAPEEEAPQDTRNIYQRLHAVMGEVSYIQKQQPAKDGAGLPYSVVTHDMVTAAVRPALIKHGIHYAASVVKYTQDGNRTEVLVAVTFRNIDDPEDNLEVFSLGQGIDKQDKGPGKAMSYAVKYALLKTLGLETGDDPDLDQKTEHVSAEDEHEAEFKADRKRLYAECVTAAKDLSGDAKETVAKWMTDHGHRWDTVTLDALGVCLDKMKADAMTEPEGMDADFEATTE